MVLDKTFFKVVAQNAKGYGYTATLQNGKIAHPLILFSKKGNVPLAAITFTSAAASTLIWERPKDGTPFNAAHFQGLIKMAATDKVSFEFSIHNFCPTCILFQIIKQHEVPMVNGSNHRLNQVNELRPQESYTVLCDRSDNLRLAISALSATVRTAEVASGGVPEQTLGSYYFLQVACETGHQKVKQLFTDTEWRAVDYFVLPSWFEPATPRTERPFVGTSPYPIVYERRPDGTSGPQPHTAYGPVHTIRTSSGRLSRGRVVPDYHGPSDQVNPTKPDDDDGWASFEQVHRYQKSMVKSSAWAKPVYKGGGGSLNITKGIGSLFRKLYTPLSQPPRQTMHTEIPTATALSVAQTPTALSVAAPDKAEPTFERLVMDTALAAQVDHLEERVEVKSFKTNKTYQMDVSAALCVLCLSVAPELFFQPEATVLQWAQNTITDILFERPAVIYTMDECCVCLDKKATLLFYTCGHQGACSCILEATGNLKINCCMICREPIVAFKVLE